MCLPFEVVFISTNIQSWFGPLSISLDFEEDRIRGCWNISLKYFVFVVENIRRRTVIVLKLYRGFILKRKRNINQQKKLGLPWRCLEFFNFFFFKSCLWIWVLIGGERCLKVTLQKLRTRKFLLMSMGGWAEGLASADPGARTPIGVIGNFLPSCGDKSIPCLLLVLISLSVSLEVIGQYWSSTISVKIIVLARF